MPEDDKKKQQFVEIEEQAPEPWRALMSDVVEIMEAAINEAVKIMSRRIGGITSIRDSGPEIIIPMSVAIFNATAQAEAARRMIAAQKEMSIGAPLKAGARRLVRVGPDGRPV